MKYLINKIINLIPLNKRGDIPEYTHLTSGEIYKNLQNFLENGLVVICDLSDRDGKMGLEIKSVKKNMDNDIIILILKNNYVKTLKDNFLYNLKWDSKKNLYRLSEQDEFFEKIKILN